jgi:hypothetical protein
MRRRSSFLICRTVPLSRYLPLPLSRPQNSLTGNHGIPQGELKTFNQRNKSAKHREVPVSYS